MMSADTCASGIDAWDFERIFTDIPGAFAAASAALERAMEASDALAEAQARLVLGTAQTYRDRQHDAHHHLQIAMRLFDATGQRVAWLTAASRFAAVQMHLGQLHEAHDLLESGLPDVRELPDRRLLIEYLNNLHATASDLGNWGHSIDYLSEAQALALESGWVVGRLWTAVNLSSVYVNLMDMDSAVITAREALALVTDIPQYRTFGSYLLSALAEAERNLGHTEEAIRLFDECARISIDAHDVRSISGALLNAARLRMSIGDSDGALANYRAVVAAASMEQDAHAPHDAQTMSDLVVMGRWGVEALTDAWTRETAQALAQLIADNRPSDMGTQVVLHDALAAAYVGLGDLATACEQYARCIVLRERHVRDTLARQVVVAVSAAQTREARLHAAEERQRREETDRVLRQVQLLNEENTALIQQLQQQSALLDQLSRTDALTGLANRRSFDDRFQLTLTQRALRPTALVVALADVDHFKEINDQWSHGIGDQVLRQVAVLMAEVTRETDVLARYGGEEFALLFSGTDANEARAVAERVRASIAAYDWLQIASGLQVTISIGIYTAQVTDSPDEMLAAADRLLYRAKHLGRNRVEAG